MPQSRFDFIIIADDLTGAADTAVQFSKRGMRAAVIPGPEIDPQCVDGSVQVLAVNTESRHISPKEAGKRVAAAVGMGREFGCRRFYKKIDSTFRGNVGAELETFLRALAAKRLILVPAYPSGGRVTRDGHQYVNGTALHATAFSRDPAAPVAESFIPAVLASQTCQPVHLAGRSTRADAVAKEGIIVCDAETDADLQAIAAEIGESDESTVFAGAAGFAEVLASRFAGDSLPKIKRDPVGRLLVLNGSLNDTSIGQVEHARLTGVPCLPLMVGSSPAGFREVARKAVELLTANSCVIVTTTPATPEATAAFAPTVTAFAAALAPLLLSAASPGLPEPGLAVFGGETAAAICRSFDCQTLYPCDEIVPGLTVCTTSGSVFTGPLILKSGGFGPPDVINRIREYLSGT